MNGDGAGKILKYSKSSYGVCSELLLQMSNLYAARAATYDPADQVDVRANLNSQINFLGIAYQDKEKDSIAAAYKWQLPFPSVQDPRSLLRDYYSINGLPITLLLDKDGKLIERISGPVGNPEDFINRVTGKLISY